MSGEPKPFPAVRTDADEQDAQLSPDGRWIAYASNETGRMEVYVQAFPGPGAKTAISTAGGTQPRWRGDAQELFYIAADRSLTSVPIRTSPDGRVLEAGAKTPLFPSRTPMAEPFSGIQYSVSPDGQRFLVNALIEDSPAPPLGVILNWRPKRPPN